MQWRFLRCRPSSPILSSQSSYTKTGHFLTQIDCVVYMLSHGVLIFSRAPLNTGLLLSTLDEGSESLLGDNASVQPDSEADQFFGHRPTSIKRPTSTLRPNDKRLEKLNMTFWTSVSISDATAAKIISLYLETDHPLLGTFEPDLFVDDLTSCRLRHCSPLLVSTIMYWGCVSEFAA